MSIRNQPTIEKLDVNSLMRLCFIGDMTSIHVRKWVQFFCDRGHHVHVISSHFYPGKSFLSATIHNLTGPGARDLIDKLGLLDRAKQMKGLSHRLLPDSLVLELAKWETAKFEQRRLEQNLRLIQLYRGRIAQLVHDFRPDLVQALRLFPEGLLASFSEFQPLVLMAWGQDLSFDAARYPEVAKLTREAIPKCMAYFADNYRDVREARQYGLIEGKLWHITPGGGGVHTNQLQSAAPRELSSSDNRPVVFMTYRRIGGIFTDNRPVICTIAILRKRLGLNSRFVIFGDRGGPGYDQVRLEAKRQGISSFVSVYPPFPYHELAAKVSKCELIVSAATTDGTSNALLETMWLGGIPLCSNLEPTREWITDGVNGYLFNMNNIEQIVEKFAQAIAERKRYPEIRSVNRRIIKEKADYQSCMRKVEEIYLQFIQ